MSNIQVTITLGKSPSVDSYYEESESSREWSPPPPLPGPKQTAKRSFPLDKKLKVSKVKWECRRSDSDEGTWSPPTPKFDRPQMVKRTPANKNLFVLRPDPLPARLSEPIVIPKSVRPTRNCKVVSELQTKEFTKARLV